MKLKFIKSPRAGQNELTAMTSEGVFHWAKIGEDLELPEQAAHEVMAKWPGCLQESKGGGKKKAATKMTKAPENKSVDQEDPVDGEG